MIRKHSLLSSPVSSVDSLSIKIHLWAHWHYAFDLCGLSRSVACNDLNMTHATHHWFVDWHYNNSPEHQISTFTGILKLKFKAVHCWNETRLKVAIFCCEAVFERITQHYKWDHTVIYAFSLISIGLRAPCWRSKSSPATHHLPPGEHREAPLSLVTAVLLAHSVHSNWPDSVLHL